MRIILLCLLLVGCIPKTELKNMEVCTLTPKEPRSLVCQKLFDTEQYPRILDSEDLWVVISVKEFTKLTVFAQQYCDKYPKLCKGKQ